MCLVWHLSCPIGNFQCQKKENLTYRTYTVSFKATSLKAPSPPKLFFFSFMCGEVTWKKRHADESTCCRVCWQHLCADVHKQTGELSLTHTPLTWISECFLSLKPTRVPGVMNVVTHLLSTGNTQDGRGCRLLFLAYSVKSRARQM